MDTYRKEELCVTVSAAVASACVKKSAHSKQLRLGSVGFYYVRLGWADHLLKFGYFEYC